MKTFRKALQSEQFAITAELSLNAENPARQALEQAEVLTGRVDGVVVGGDPHISPTALAALLIRNGVDPVVKLNCRDRNRIALHSDLLGLRAIGVSSLVLNRDGDSNSQDHIPAKAVFDVNCRELVAMAHSINEEEWSDGHHEFLIGTLGEAFEPGPEWAGEPLVARAGAGARFLQTLPCFDVGVLRVYLQKLVELKLTWSYSVTVTLAPLCSAEAARRLLEDRQGTVIPEDLIHSLETAADPEREGIEICANLMREIADIPGVSGVNLLTLENPGAVVETIRASGLT